MTSLTRMASFRDTDTAVSSNNGADDITVDTTPSIRNRIAFKTGHILSNLTLSVWYSYALLYFQNVVTLSPLSAGILFFISQILMAVTFLVINLGRDERIWKPFSSYGIQKARHAMGSAGILFAWPFAFTPCLFCEADTSHLVLGMYYLIPVVLLSICWPLVELSYSSLMKEIRAENDNDYDASRFIVRMCKVGLYIVLWFLLQESTENRLNPNISEQFAYLDLILLPVGFVFVFAFHLTFLEHRPQCDRPRETGEAKLEDDKNCGRSTADISTPSTVVNQGLTRLYRRPKPTWYDWLKERQFGKVGCVVLFTNTAFRIVQCYLPLYLIETLQLRKESVAFFPLIIVMTRMVTEIICKSFISRLKVRVVILCTTTAIFGICLWFFLQSTERTPTVYAPTVIFASMSSLLTIVTPTMHLALTENEKEFSIFISGEFDCTEKLLLGVIVLILQILYPYNTDRSVGEFLRTAFPTACATCIVVPMIVATAFMNSRNTSEGPVLTITAASPRENSGPVQTSLPLMNYVDRLERSTPPVDIEQNHFRKTHCDCGELQGSTSTAAPSDVEQEDTRVRSYRDQDAGPDETHTHSHRDQDIEVVKQALDELHRLPSTDL